MKAIQSQSFQLIGANQQTYESLKASMSLDLRRQLLIAVCDSVEMQAQIATQLEQDIQQQVSVEQASGKTSAGLAKPMERLLFDADDGNLPQQIANWMRHTLFTVGSLPRLQVLGIEQMTRQPAITQNYFLRSLDKIEALLPQLNTSLLVWVPWPWLRTIQQSSSTFWNWRNGVFEFISDPEPTATERQPLDIDAARFEPDQPSTVQPLTSPTVDSGDRLQEEAANNGQVVLPASTAIAASNGSSPSAGFVEIGSSAITDSSPEAASQAKEETAFPDASSPDSSVADTPMPLEFWDDDDFPIFDIDGADIEENARKLDREESSVSVPELSPVPDSASADSAPADSLPAGSAVNSVEEPQIAADESASQPKSDVIEADTPVQEPIETDTSEQESIEAETTAANTPTQEPIEAEAIAANTPTQETVEVDAIAPKTAPFSEPAPARIVQPKRATKRKRKQNFAAFGGLQSVVSQGVNLDAQTETNETSAASQTPVASQISQKTPAQKPAANLTVTSHVTNDGITKQVSTQQISTRQVGAETSGASANGGYQTLTTTDIPVLPQKKQSEVSAQTATTKEIVTDKVAVAQKGAGIDRVTPTQEAANDMPAVQGTRAQMDSQTRTQPTPPDLIPSEQTQPSQAQEDTAAQEEAGEYFAEGLTYRNRIEAGERGLEVIEPAIAAYEKGLACLRDPHPDQITGLNDLGTLYWLKAQQQSDKAQAVSCMHKSIQLYQEALEKSQSIAADEGPHSDIISQLHSNMGAVFTMLATCENPVNYLTQAAQSYQNALPLIALKESPQEYATLHNSLGSVYWKLSHYESVESHLHQAIAAYQEALLGYQPDQHPLDYAAVQNNLGITYWSLAKHERPKVLLKQAITAYRDALKYRTSDVDPAACAISYNNLALAYWDLAKHTHGDIEQKSRYQKNAVTAFEAALNINNLSGALSPMDSAAIYHCLGDVHAQMIETAPSLDSVAESLQKSLYSYIKSIENLSTDSPAYPPRFGAIVANLRLHYDKLGLEGQQNALNRVPPALLPQVMMAL